jgi:hypothetical protein
MVSQRPNPRLAVDAVIWSNPVRRQQPVVDRVSGPWRDPLARSILGNAVSPVGGTTAKEEGYFPTGIFSAALRPVHRQVLTVVATRERLLGFEEPSGSGVVGGLSAHQGYLQ